MMMKVTKILLFIASLILGGFHSILHVVADETKDNETTTTTDATTPSNGTITSTTSTTTTTNTTTDENDSTNTNDEKNISFDNMSNEELEAICTSRGFEIVKEIDESGNARKFSREEYVDAATQCLEIEAEMEQILNDHPHLLDEIENEAERMRKEKLTLEEQLAEAKANLELEEERIKLGERFKAAFVNENDDENESGDISGETANETTIQGEESLDGEQKETQQEEESQTGSDTLNNNDENDNNNASISTSSSSGGGDEEEEVIDLDNCCDTTKTEDKKIRGEIQKGEEDQGENNDEAKENGPQLAIGNGNETKSADSIITIKDLILEFRSQVTKDFTRIADIVFPVAYREPVISFVRPIIIVVKDSVMQVYDMVKRYAVTIFKDYQKTDSRTGTSVDDESRSTSESESESESFNEMEEEEVVEQSL